MGRRSLMPLGGVVLLAACAGAPAASAPPQGLQSPPATTAASLPAGTLDPSLSDAGVVARVTVMNDTRAGRDGTYEVIGVREDGSDCGQNFDGTTYTAVAWVDDAPIGQIHRFGVTVSVNAIPDDDATLEDLSEGAVSFDFVSESGVGTQYTGAASRPNEGRSTVAVTRSGRSLTFDFEGETYDGVDFAGRMVCADG